MLENALLKDVLVRLHSFGLYRACWSDQILRDAAGSLETSTVLHLKDLFPECMIQSDQYAPLITATRAETHDGHVTALCVRAHAEVIVAMNPEQFPDEILKRLGVEAQHPDEFLCNLLDLKPSTVIQAVVELAADTRQPPRTVLQLLESLGRVTPQFAEGILYHLPAEMQSPS